MRPQHTDQDTCKRSQVGVWLILRPEGQPLPGVDDRKMCLPPSNDIRFPLTLRTATDTFTYDDADRILTAVKGRYSNTVTFAYDEGGRRASEALTTGGQTYTVNLDYDDAGRTVEITYPDGTTLDRTYTDRGQLEEVEYESADVASFVYDNGGRETSRTFGNSLVTTTSYITGENLIAALTNSTVGNYSYTYDANDNKTAETITGAMSGYGFTTPSGYDDEDRLVAWERDDAAQDLSWVLSDVGDWDAYSVNTVTENRRAGAVHELTAIDEWHRPLLVPPSPPKQRGMRGRRDRG